MVFKLYWGCKWSQVERASHFCNLFCCRYRLGHWIGLSLEASSSRYCISRASSSLYEKVIQSSRVYFNNFIKPANHLFNLMFLVLKPTYSQTFRHFKFSFLLNLPSQKTKKSLRIEVSAIFVIAIENEQRFFFVTSELFYIVKYDETH